jgi:hypothetical protein
MRDQAPLRGCPKQKLRDWNIADDQVADLGDRPAM